MASLNDYFSFGVKFIRNAHLPALFAMPLLAYASSVSRTQKLAFVVGLLSSDVSSHLTLFPNFADLFKAAVVKLCERVHALTRAFRYTNRRHT